MRTIHRVHGPGLFLTALLTALAAPWASSAMQGQLDKDPWRDRLASLDADLPDWMREAGIPGLALAVVTPGETWSRTYGVRRVGAPAPVGLETIFEAASLSKPVFAHLVRGLLREGIFELDVPLSDYWDYPDLANDPWRDRVTGRTVLAHRSGLPNWRRDGPLEIQFRPGERFQYSGEGYVYLQRVAAELLGQDLPGWAEGSLFDALGMDRSSYLFDTTDTDYAIPHDEEGRPVEKRPAVPPGNAAASLHTTAENYGRFLQAVLRLLGRDPLEYQALVHDATEVAPGVEWGLGWGLEYGGSGRASIWHWGDNGPFKAFVYADLEREVGVVFFANSSHGLALTGRVLERLFPGAHPLLDWLDYDQLH